jgi:signal transduction histidine kinase/CheY-like chemotaxis protein
VDVSLLAQIAEDAPFIMAFHDPQQKIVWANAAYREATGLDLDQLRGEKCWAAWGLEQPCRGCPVTTTVETGRGAEAELTPDNQEHWPAALGSWLARATPIHDDSGELIGAIEAAFDITERKRSEAALRRFEWLLEKEQQDAEPHPYEAPYGDITALNTCRVIRDAVGAEALEAMGRDLMDLLDTSVAIYEANGDYAYGLFDSRWCRLLDSASFARCRTDDPAAALDCGRWLCHENCWNDSAKAAIESGAPTDIACVGGIRLYAVPIRAGDEVIGAVNIGYGTPPTDERSVRELAARFELQPEALQRAAAAYKPRPQYIIDVAKRRCRTIARSIGAAVERVQMEAQMAQTDRLSSMGVLAAGLAHEINNPLAYVLYNLESLTADLPELLGAVRRFQSRLADRFGDETLDQVAGEAARRINPLELDDIRARFDDALQGSRRIREVARGLGAFSRVSEDRLVPVELEHVIEAALKLASNEIRHRARLVRDYGRGVPAVQANEGRLSQVFLNLLLNACHAIDAGRRDENQIAIKTWAEPDQVCASIRDSGSGIAAGQQRSIFEPFFTTKPLGEGSGLGLSISKSIVEDHGGSIAVDSQPGQGAIFTVRLPLRRRPADAAGDTAAAAADTDGARGRVLLVDDEPGIRSMLARILREHDCVTAASGVEAQRILQQDQAFDVILCDMMMPEFSGMDLHAWLAETHPALAERLVFITGGAFTPGARDYLARIDNPRIDKPFQPAEVRELVSARIAAAGSKQTSR